MTASQLETVTERMLAFCTLLQITVFKASLKPLTIESS